MQPGMGASVSRTDDVLDAIDDLVDAQLAQYDRRSGYDHNVNQDLCRICGETAHTLPITETMRKMRAEFHTLATLHLRSETCAEIQARHDAYRYTDDDSPIVCPGSDFIGPWITPQQRRYSEWGQVWPGLFQPGNWIPPEAWLACTEPSWWRCVDLDGLTFETRFECHSNHFGISEATHTLTVNGESRQLVADPDGTHLRYGRDVENGPVTWVEIHCATPPSHGEWTRGQQ